MGPHLPAQGAAQLPVALQPPAPARHSAHAGRRRGAAFGGQARLAGPQEAEVTGRFLALPVYPPKFESAGAIEGPALATGMGSTRLALKGANAAAVAASRSAGAYWAPSFDDSDSDSDRASSGWRVSRIGRRGVQVHLHLGWPASATAPS